jgi:hypothetical protein
LRVFGSIAWLNFTRLPVGDDGSAASQVSFGNGKAQYSGTMGSQSRASGASVTVSSMPLGSAPAAPPLPPAAAEGTRSSLSSQPTPSWAPSSPSNPNKPPSHRRFIAP